MIIAKHTDKYILLSDDGYILHTEKELHTMRSYISEIFSATFGMIKPDFSQLYRDERGYYITRDQLLSEMPEDDERTAAEYISDCMSINGGTLEAVNG